MDIPEEKLKERIEFLQTIIRNERDNRRQYVFEEGKKIRESVEFEKQKIQNQGLLQDITLKRDTLFILFKFLRWETIVLFIFVALQALCIFHLEEWAFRLLIVATISQITYMLQFAVKHLFPNK